MELLVLGEGCEKCSALYENTLEAVRQLQLDAQVRKVEDLMEIVMLGVLSAPSLMVEGKLLLSGRVASAKAIAALLKEKGYCR